MPEPAIEPPFICAGCGRRLILDGIGNVTTLARCRCGRVTLMKVVPRG